MLAFLLWKNAHIASIFGNHKILAMKTFNWFFLMPVMLVMFACGKERTIVQVPDAVQSAYLIKYGEINGATWTSVADTIFVSTFIKETRSTQAFFNHLGQWLKSETELKSSELPAAVVQTITYVFPGRSISKALYVENKDAQATYLLSLKRGRHVEEVRLSTLGALLDEVRD
jgi:hypothetical protein